VRTAVDWLEQALKFGRVQFEVAYMLALAYKRLGKNAEARTTLHKIAEPDANVLLQLGLLSLADRQLPQAEQEFGRAWELDPQLYAAGFNLLLALLGQGKIQAAAAIVHRLEDIGRGRQDVRKLALLGLLLQRCIQQPGDRPPPLPVLTANGASPHDPLAAMIPADEQELLSILNGLGRAAAFPLLRTLAQARPGSKTLQEAFATAVLVEAKQLVDRCSWQAAEHLLLPIATNLALDGAAAQLPLDLQLATFNLLGCCECMLQEFDQAVQFFTQAARLAPSDPWLHQNLALTHEICGRLDLADSHWNRYFELQENVPAPDVPHYRGVLAYEGMNRLADAYSKKEHWNTALTYLQRASRLRPDDVDALERLFHMYNQVKRPEDARRALRRLQELRPNDPQLELYELDLREVRTLEDIDRMLADIRKTLNRHPNDMRVEEKAVQLVQSVIPLIGRMSEQYTDQLQRVREQVRRLPNYQINWAAVHDVARDLQREFQKLRRIASKCLALVLTDDHRRVIRELMQQIDRKIETCQALGR
jgi:Flp pilus assembly protein TadD